MINVVHCKVVQNHEYIGRPSVLGNMFTHKKGTKADVIVASREEAVAMYRKWIVYKIKQKDKDVLDELRRLKQIAINGELNLGCWCAPQACHGDVIKDILERSINKDKKKVE